MKQWILFLLFLNLISSCSIEKRVYKRGYFIQWNKLDQKTPTASEIIQNKKKYISDLPDSVAIETSIAKPSDVYDLNSTQQIAPQVPENSFQNQTNNIQATTQNVEQDPDESDLSEEETYIAKTKKMAHRAAVLGLWSQIGGYVLIGLPLGIPAFIYGLTALIRMRKSKSSYTKKDRMKAWLGIALGLLSMLTIVVVLLLIFLY